MSRRIHPLYGVVDTTFARVDMGSVAQATLEAQGVDADRIVRRTVPGFKDLGVAAKKLIEEEGCDIVVACGMAGAAAIDKQCAHEATQGIQLAQLLTNRHVLEVFVHTDEAEEDRDLVAVCRNRAAEHALNAYWLMEAPDELGRRAGTGQRQGFEDEGPVAGGRPARAPDDWRTEPPVPPAGSGGH